MSELDTDVFVRLAAWQCTADLVAREDFAVDIVTRCLEVEGAMQCSGKVSPKGDDGVILALSA